MNTAFMTPKEWAWQEFVGADLGDQRRTRRLVGLGASLVEQSHGRLTPSLHTWADLKGAYRLLSTSDVTYEKITEPHRQRVREACRQAEEILLVEDTTSLDYSTHRKVRGMGLIGDGGGSGLYLHTTLAMGIDRWTETDEPQVTLLGLFDQQYWTRSESTGAATEKKSHRLGRPRESQRWAAVFAQTGGPPPGSRWTYVADRESDIFEVFQRCGTAAVAFIIRANQPRALADEGGSIFQAAAEAPRMGRFSAYLRSRPARVKRAKRKGQTRRVTRPAQPGRTVHFEVRARQVRLRRPWRPAEKGASQTLNVVYAREVDPPEGADPIEWVLLTTWPIDSLRACMRVINAYVCRWLIEKYHKALKTGTGIEKSQLSCVERITALLGIQAVVAVRLLSMKLLARTDESTALGADVLGLEALALLEAAYGPPREGWTNRAALIAIARLGGFPARKGDGLPGWVTLWRGWEKLLLMLRGHELLSGGRSG